MRVIVEAFKRVWILEFNQGSIEEDEIEDEPGKVHSSGGSFEKASEEIEVEAERKFGFG